MQRLLVITICSLLACKKPSPTPVRSDHSISESDAPKCDSDCNLKKKVERFKSEVQTNSSGAKLQEMLAEKESQITAYGPKIKAAFAEFSKNFQSCLNKGQNIKPVFPQKAIDLIESLNDNDLAASLINSSIYAFRDYGLGNFDNTDASANSSEQPSPQTPQANDPLSFYNDRINWGIINMLSGVFVIYQVAMSDRSVSFSEENTRLKEEWQQYLKTSSDKSFLSFIKSKENNEEDAKTLNNINKNNNFRNTARIGAGGIGLAMIFSGGFMTASGIGNQQRLVDDGCTADDQILSLLAQYQRDLTELKEEQLILKEKLAAAN